jgi:hypothetical protein
VSKVITIISEVFFCLPGLLHPKHKLVQSTNWFKAQIGSKHKLVQSTNWFTYHPTGLLRSTTRLIPGWGWPSEEWAVAAEESQHHTVLFVCDFDPAAQQ